MPGISGFVSSADPILQPQSLVERVRRADTVLARSPVSSQYVGNSAVILNLATGLLGGADSHYACNSAAGLHLFLEGEVYDDAYLSRESQTGRVVSSAAALLRAFEAMGTELSSRLNGEFTIAVFDERDRSLHVMCDHVSSQAFYYYETEGGLYFGAEKKCLQAMTECGFSVDPVGLLQFFNHRHYILDRTFVRGLKRLEAGGILKYRDGRLQLSQQTQLRFDGSAAGRRVDELADEWSDRIRVATQRRLRSDRRLVVSLSAGLDSRVIVGALPRDYRPVAARTRGVSGSDEVRLASDIAASLDLDHFREPPDLFEYGSGLAKVVWRTEGEVTFFNGPTLFNHDRIRESGDFLAGGYLGNIASGSGIDPLMLLPADRGAFVERIYSQRYARFPRSALSDLFQPAFLDAHLDDVRQEFVDSYGRLDQDRNADLHQLWTYYHRGPRMTIAAGPVDSHVLQRHSPLFDRDVVDFFLTLPASLRLGQVLYRCMIYRLVPEIRHVPNSNNLRTVKATATSNRVDYALDFGRKVAGKLGVKRAQGQRVPTEDVGRRLREDTVFREQLTAMCRAREFDEGIFNRKGILSLLDSHYAGQQDHSHLIGLLATMLQASRFFVDRVDEAPAY